MLGGLGAVFELLGALGIKMFDFPIIYSKWNDDRNWGILMMSWWRRHQDEIS